MGIFSKRPEEPAQSIRLPSEPDVRRSDAEVLGDPGPAVGELDFLTATAPGTAWIEIPASPDIVPEPFAPEDGD